MSELYTDARQSDAARIADTLRRLDGVLQSPALGEKAADATALRRNVVEVLKELNADLAELERVNRADTFGTDPSLANQRMNLIRRVEGAKIDYEFDVLPALARLTTGVLEQTKQTVPGDQVVASLPPEPSGERWTVRKVIDSAEQFISTASKAVGAASQGYALVKALALLAGVPLP